MLRTLDDYLDSKDTNLLEGSLDNGHDLSDNILDEEINLLEKEILDDNNPFLMSEDVVVKVYGTKKYFFRNYGTNRMVFPYIDPELFDKELDAAIRELCNIKDRYCVALETLSDFLPNNINCYYTDFLAVSGFIFDNTLSKFPHFYIEPRFEHYIEWRIPNKLGLIPSLLRMDSASQVYAGTNDIKAINSCIKEKKEIINKTTTISKNPLVKDFIDVCTKFKKLNEKFIAKKDKANTLILNTLIYDTYPSIFSSLISISALIAADLGKVDEIFREIDNKFGISGKKMSMFYVKLTVQEVVKRIIRSLGSTYDETHRLMYGGEMSSAVNNDKMSYELFVKAYIDKKEG